jgi:hypoxanthine phosphoribosyltransferase
MIKDIHVCWEEYSHLIEKLAVGVKGLIKIKGEYGEKGKGYDFNQIVCIAKGGLRIGDVFHRIFDRPKNRVSLAILSAESYGVGDESGIKNQRGNVIFSRDLAKTTPDLGSHVLLVDDLTDSGTTLKRSVDWLNSYYGFHIEEVRTATLWHKRDISEFTSDYYVEAVPGKNPWIHQPVEKYEKMNIEELKHRVEGYDRINE